MYKYFAKYEPLKQLQEDAILNTTPIVSHLNMLLFFPSPPFPPQNYWTNYSCLGKQYKKNLFSIILPQRSSIGLLVISDLIWTATA